MAGVWTEEGVWVEDGWEVGYSRAKLVAALERGDKVTDVVYDVILAHSAQEAAQFLLNAALELFLCWSGTNEDGDYVLSFIQRFGAPINGGYEAE